MESALIGSSIWGASFAIRRIFASKLYRKETNDVQANMPKTNLEFATKLGMRERRQDWIKGHIPKAMGLLGLVGAGVELYLGNGEAAIGLITMAALHLAEGKIYTELRKKEMKGYEDRDQKKDK
jgi:hypothetical protein